MTREFILRRVLLQPELLLDLPAPEVSRAVSQGRISRLLAALATEVERTGLMPRLDERVRRHLLSAQLVAEKQRHDLDYDCKSLQRALASAGQKLVLLKGGAYIQADLPVGRGRLITDIDIIVPKADIEAAEQALNSHGWESSQLDPYNEHYYREWSHETPALVNRKRGTTLDLHHNILPPTSAPNVDASLLFERLREVQSGVYTLSLQDMVIHSATHLFHEGEFHHGLRDLWDLDRMLRDFPEREANFWDGLVPRARELELETPLFHGLTYTRLVFQTPVPASVIGEVDSPLRRLRQPLLDFLYLRAFRPLQPDCQLPLTAPALNLLYLRSHFLRMPLHLLAPHLIRKAWMRRAAGSNNKPSAQKEVDTPRV